MRFLGVFFFFEGDVWRKRGEIGIDFKIGSIGDLELIFMRRVRMQFRKSLGGMWQFVNKKSGRWRGRLRWWRGRWGQQSDNGFWIRVPLTVILGISNSESIDFYRRSVGKERLHVVYLREHDYRSRSVSILKLFFFFQNTFLLNFINNFDLLNSFFMIHARGKVKRRK